MIEQGKVDLLLQANPQERRLIFEEAAGISKYKQRKKEAQRKLEKVEQNLLRVNDIVAGGGEAASQREDPGRPGPHLPGVFTAACASCA